LESKIFWTKQAQPGIWHHANELLAGNELTVHGILKRFRVRAVCTTDDPTDDLHIISVLLAPIWRLESTQRFVLTGRSEPVMQATSIYGSSDWLTPQMFISLG